MRSIPVDLIAPGAHQARRHFDAERLAELAESIRETGVLQPVVLRSLGRQRYELLAGERRWRAAQLAGLHEIPALVRDDLDDDEAHVLGLVENLQRESLSPMETAHGLERLRVQAALTHEALAQRVGKPRVYVTHHLRLLSLTADVQMLVDDGTLSLGHAKVLAGLPATRQRELAARCVRDRWSVRVLERHAGDTSQRAAKAGAAWSADQRQLELALSEQLGYAAQLEHDGQGRGSLRLRFQSLDELDGLLSRLGYRDDP